MTPISKTSAPDVVELRPAKPAADARRISSLIGQPTIHSDPAHSRGPVHVKPAWKAPSARFLITKQSLAAAPSAGHEVTAVVAELGASKQIQSHIGDRLMSLQSIQNPSEDDKDEYTKLCCTLIKNLRVPVGQAGVFVRAALSYMMPSTGRS